MTPAGEGGPSSLAVSTPASEVVFDGTEELVGVLAVFAVLPKVSLVRLIILMAAGVLWLRDPASMPIDGGLQICQRVLSNMANLKDSIQSTLITFVHHDGIAVASNHMEEVVVVRKLVS